MFRCTPFDIAMLRICWNREWILSPFKELLGHANIETTMMYLHVAKVDRVNAHSPLDRLYEKQ